MRTKNVGWCVKRTLPFYLPIEENRVQFARFQTMFNLALC